MPARKIGILTLQNQVNYGGVLQAYALQRVLRNKGYAAEVVDYWLEPRNAMLCGRFFEAGLSPVARAVRILRSVIKWGVYYVRMDLRRRRRTIRFIRDSMAVSPVAYESAAALRAIRGYDCLVVGSDQVWNYEWHGRPNPFLLGQVDASVPRVSYAASFGFKELPAEYLEEYRQGLAAFRQISVREKEGVEMVKAWTGREAQWVLDPSLLLPEGEWREVAGGGAAEAPFIFCYWLGDLRKGMELVRRLTRRHGARVRLFVSLPQLYGKRRLGDWLLRTRLFLMPRVKVCSGAGPKEFLEGLAGAEAVVSDSFHALMFSCVFRKPVKIILNSSPKRAGMAARMKDFAERYRIAEAIESDVPGQELAFSRPDYGEVWREIEKDRERSLRFIDQALS